MHDTDASVMISHGQTQSMESVEQIIGRKCFVALHKTDKPIAECQFERTQKHLRSFAEKVHDFSFGISLLVTTSPILDDTGQFIDAMHIAKDITDIVSAQCDLQRQRGKVLKELRAALQVYPNPVKVRKIFCFMQERRN